MDMARAMARIGRMMTDRLTQRMSRAGLGRLQSSLRWQNNCSTYTRGGPRRRWHGARGFQWRELHWLVQTSSHYGCADQFRSPQQRSRILAAGPHVLPVIVGPYPARTNAVIPPTAMPEMPLVSTHAECAPVKSMPVYGWSRSSHDPCARSVPSPEMSAGKVSATKMSTTKVSATKVVHHQRVRHHDQRRDRRREPRKHRWQAIGCQARELPPTQRLICSSCLAPFSARPLQKTYEQRDEPKLN
jgi:hypothetical protein